MSPPLAGLSRSIAILSALATLPSCTLHHSKQALFADTPGSLTPPLDARFVSEEDSGLSIFGLFVLAEPDHYAVLLERMRRDHRCARLLYPQLDFYTDHWLLIAFPIARVTSLCEPDLADAPSSIPALPEAPGGHDGRDGQDTSRSNTAPIAPTPAGTLPPQPAPAVPATDPPATTAPPSERTP